MKRSIYTALCMILFGILTSTHALQIDKAPKGKEKTELGAIEQQKYQENVAEILTKAADFLKVNQDLTETKAITSYVESDDFDLSIKFKSGAEDNETAFAQSAIEAVSKTDHEKIIRTVSKLKIRKKDDGSIRIDMLITFDPQEEDMAKPTPQDLDSSGRAIVVGFRPTHLIFMSEPLDKTPEFVKIYVSPLSRLVGKNALTMRNIFELFVSHITRTNKALIGTLDRARDGNGLSKPLDLPPPMKNTAPDNDEPKALPLKKKPEDPKNDPTPPAKKERRMPPTDPSKTA